jgi:uncharacterized protein YjbJ (UPF0337 family)
MAGEMDELKGRAKEAAGAVTDDEKLRREGKVDQAAGDAKDKAGKKIDQAKEATQKKS